MVNNLQTIIDNQNIAKTNAERLIEAFGAPFTEAGEILSNYKEIVVEDETQVDLMKEAKTKRLALKKVRTTVENKRKELKEDSLRTGKAIDFVARHIKDTIQPAEEYLETQEKYIENKEIQRKATLKEGRLQKLIPICENPYTYELGEMTDDEFKKLYKELVDAKELKEAQEAAYQREQEKIRAEREAEEKRIREENETLRKQAQVREAEIAKEREEQEVIRQAELAAERDKAKNDTANRVKIALDTLEQFTSPEVNNGKAMVDYQSVINLFIKK